MLWWIVTFLVGTVANIKSVFDTVFDDESDHCHIFGLSLTIGTTNCLCLVRFCFFACAWMRIWKQTNQCVLDKIMLYWLLINTYPSIWRDWLRSSSFLMPLWSSSEAPLSHRTLLLWTCRALSTSCAHCYEHSVINNCLRRCIDWLVLTLWHCSWGCHGPLTHVEVFSSSQGTKWISKSD